MPRWTAIFIVLSIGCVHRPPPVDQGLTGPRVSTLPLYRNPGSAEKIFIEAKLSDGIPRLFLVDTGAAISVVSQRAAINLNMPIHRQAGRISGVGGTSDWLASQIKVLRLGKFSMADIPVAVGVTGVPTQVGLVPLDGIIGSDILGQFQVEVDYPAQTLTLSRPGEIEPPPHAVPLFFNGQHPLTQTTFTARNSSGLTVDQPVMLEIDTGSRGLLLIGNAKGELDRVATRGLEPIMGVGSSSIGIQRQETRRVPVVRLPVGGQIITRPQTARWIQFDASPSRHTPQIRGQLGYQAMKNHRLLLDYPDKRFALSPSHGERAVVDVHEWFIRRGTGGDDPVQRVRALYIIGRAEEARRRLTRLAQQPSTYPSAAALLSRIERREGKVAAAADRLATLSVRDLIDTGELISSVNGLWLAGRNKEATLQAKSATVLAPDSPVAWVAFADAQLADGQAQRAREAIAEAVSIEANPDAYLLRRALIARIDHDTDGALAHLRRLIRASPTEGYAHWLYAQTAIGDERRAMAGADLKRAESLLHPGDEPLDFLAGAWYTLDDKGHAAELKAAGIQRDCSRARDAASKANCEAWYQALIGADLEDAENKVQAALAVHPNRSEFLDTLALVLEARGDVAGARNASWLAAAASPDDVYLVSQALRLKAMSSNP
jgi:tetratricopeptide (TPR) repeat protein